jgi:hypothetical protein
LLEHRLHHSMAPSGDVCADPETLASYVDDGLSATERVGWEAHFATCGKCRRALALMARLKETTTAEREQAAARDNADARSAGNRWVWLPLAACLLVGTGLWFATRPADRGSAASMAPTEVTQSARHESTPGGIGSGSAEDRVSALKDEDRRESAAANERSGSFGKIGARASQAPPPAAAPPADSLTANRPVAGDKAAATAQSDRALAEEKEKPKAAIEIETRAPAQTAASADGRASASLQASPAAADKERQAAQSAPASKQQQATPSRGTQEAGQNTQRLSGPHAQQQAAPAESGRRDAAPAPGATPTPVPTGGVNGVNAGTAAPSGPTNINSNVNSNANSNASASPNASGNTSANAPASASGKANANSNNATANAGSNAKANAASNANAGSNAYAASAPGTGAAAGGNAAPPPATLAPAAPAPAPPASATTPRAPQAQAAAAKPLAEDAKTAANSGSATNAASAANAGANGATAANTGSNAAAANGGSAPRSAFVAKEPPAKRVDGAASAGVGGEAAGAVAEAVTITGGAPALKRAKSEQDALSPAERAAGLLAVVADPTNAARRWRVFRVGRIESSDNAGETWTGAPLIYDARFVATSSPAPGVCWVVGTGGIVWRKEPAKAWELQHVPSGDHLTAVVATSARDATVTTASGERLHTADAGKTWTRQ